jgi:hypothetical protein
MTTIGRYFTQRAQSFTKLAPFVLYLCAFAVIFYGATRYSFQSFAVLKKNKKRILLLAKIKSKVVLYSETKINLSVRKYLDGPNH